MSVTDGPSAIISGIETPAPASPRPAPPQAPEPAPPRRSARRRRGSRASWIGAVVSAASSLAGVVYWATQQSAPRLPQDGVEWLAVLGAVLLYGLATLVRGERWHRLLVDEGGHPSRRDTQGLNVVGYMGNNLLPARAGDAIRVVLMAPRAALGHAQRRRDAARRAAARRRAARRDLRDRRLRPARRGRRRQGRVVLLARRRARRRAPASRYLLVRRNERIMGFIAPIASATLGLRRAHHGLRLLGITMVIWAVEAAVWMSTGAAVGFGMTPIEGLYIVALASIFAMIPSGPAYAGTQDAAAIIGIKALGGTSAQAVAYVVMLRFVIVVPITLAGLALLITRYGGLGKLRTARA